MTRLRIIVSGRVQGVGYRWFVLQSSRSLGLSGWVRNRRDGTVEMEAEGSADGLERLQRELESGHPHAAVSRIDVKKIPGRGGKDFEIRESWTENESTG